MFKSIEVTLARLVVWVCLYAAKDTKPAAQPTEHIVDNVTLDLALFLSILKIVQPEGLFQSFRIGLWAYLWQGGKNGGTCRRRPVNTRIYSLHF
jgi:hypothetical protein